MQHSAEMMRCMRTLDVAGVRKLWQHMMPNMPQPKNDEDALTTLHVARTASKAMPAAARVYSHDWLLERGLPSQLPNEMLPASRRSEKRIVEAVGVSVNYRSSEMKPAALQIERAMSDAVSDAYAEGRTDVEFVRARLGEAKSKARRQLFGIE